MNKRQMAQAIWKKEWIKTRVMVTILFAAIVLYTLYTLYAFYKPVHNGALNLVWSVMIERNVIFVEGLKYLPALFGAIVAALQFFPEIVQKRLKLTLHLPATDRFLTNVLLSYGWGVTLLLVCVMLLLTWGVTAAHLPTELQQRILYSMVPWCMAAPTAYTLTAWVLLEGTMVRRFIFALIAIGLLMIFFVATFPEGNSTSMLILQTLILLYALLLPHYSINRYRLGQNI